MKNFAVHKVTVGRWLENCYILTKYNKAIIIDPGDEANKIIKIIEQNSLLPAAIINTHAHYDHVGAVSELKEKYNIPFFLHSKDKRLLNHTSIYRSFVGESVKFKIPVVDNFLDETESPKLQEFSLQIIHTPGHTEGSVCILNGNILFTGDTIMKGKIGRTDLPGADMKKYKQSLKLLAKLSPDIKIYPGHGEESRIANELESNVELKKMLDESKN